MRGVDEVTEAIKRHGGTLWAYVRATGAADLNRKHDTPKSIAARRVALAVYVRDRKRLEQQRPTLRLRLRRLRIRLGRAGYEWREARRTKKAWRRLYKAGFLRTKRPTLTRPSDVFKAKRGLHRGRRKR